MEEIKWTYQQYDPQTRTAYPVPEDKEAYESRGVKVLEEDPVEIWADIFAERDARIANCKIVSFQ